MDRKVEILAPAGSFESLKAAVNASCDAVYIGGNRFGARAFADNLSESDLLTAIDYMHLHNKKIYMTVNTLLKQDEVEEHLYSYIKPYYEEGLDAVIVQDLGAASFLHDNFKDLTIHASTQMTLTSAKGIKLLEPLGITRFVPARELSIQEIKQMRKETDLEIECFVHGALCYCFSGQCLLSSIIGGRSGNRGRCAQPCRMPYKLNGIEKNDYILSPKDICTLDLIPDLIDAGIDSFKIEGRMKRPEYTALCTHLYGKYSDLYLEKDREGYERYVRDHKEEFEFDKMALSDVYNRGGFSNGYLSQYHGKTMMSMKRPNHYGVFVGTVIETTANKAKIQFSKDVNAQDVLEFRDKDETALYDYTQGQPVKKNEEIWTNFKRGSKISVHNKIYRTKNQRQLDSIAERFINTNQKIPVNGYFVCKNGEPLSMRLELRGIEAAVQGDMVEEAKQRPLEKDKIMDAIGKIGDTKYVFDNLDGAMSQNAFLPMGAVKSLRREAFEKLEKAVLDRYIRKDRDDTLKGVNVKAHRNRSNTMGIHVSVRTKEQFDIVFMQKEVTRIYISFDDFSEEEGKEYFIRCRMDGKELYRVLPYIFRDKTYDTFSGYNLEYADGFLVRNLEEISFLKSKIENIKMISDSNVYTMNSFAKDFLRTIGIEEYTAPAELNWKELKQRGLEEDTLLVYSHLALMVSAQCLVDNCLTCEKSTGRHFITDRMGKEYFVENCCTYCYNIVFEAEAFSLLEESITVLELSPKNIRLDFIIESAKETEEILKNFIKVFRYNKNGKDCNNTNKGHFRKGVE